jgi:hypothetical protein
MNIPRTKDGKHKLLFTGSTSITRPIKLVDALVGRRLHQLIISLQSVAQAKNFDKKYSLKGKIFSQDGYDSNDDPERLFGSISIPVYGRIPREGLEVLTTEGSEEPVGYKFIEPYTSFTAGEDIEGLLSRDSLGNLLSRTSPHNLVHRLPSNLQRFFDSFGNAYDRYNEIFKKAKAQDIVEDSQVRNFLQALSLLAVENVRYEAMEVFNLKISYPFLRNRIYYGDEIGRTPINASKKLQKKVAASAIALCEEYLYEMGGKIK